MHHRIRCNTVRRHRTRPCRDSAHGCRELPSNEHGAFGHSGRSEEAQPADPVRLELPPSTRSPASLRNCAAYPGRLMAFKGLPYQVSSFISSLLSSCHVSHSAIDASPSFGSVLGGCVMTKPAVVLIDVSAGLLSPTLRALRNIGFIEAAKKGHITFVVFHILGPSIASLDEIVGTAAYLGDGKYFMVKNFINNTHFFEWDEATHAAYFKRLPDAVEMTVPKLPEMAAEQVDLASVPFATFIANKKKSGEPASYSFVLRGYVRHWLDTVWAEYDRVSLTDIVEAKESPAPTVARPRPAIRVPEATA